MKKSSLQKTKQPCSQWLLSRGLETFDLRHGMPKTPRQSYSPTCMAEGCKCSASADQKCSAYRRIQGLAKFSVVVVVRSLFVKVYRKVLNAVLLLPHLLIGDSSSSALNFYPLKFAINKSMLKIRLKKCSMAPACAGSGDRNCHSPKMAVARPDIDCVLANARNRFPAKYSQCKKEVEIVSPEIERMQHLDSRQQQPIFLEALQKYSTGLISNAHALCSRFGCGLESWNLF